MRLKGKTAIVTGGGQGLGEGMALRFAQEGASVAVVDKNPETTPAVAKRIEQAGGKAIPIVTDLITSPTSIRQQQSRPCRGLVPPRSSWRRRRRNRRIRPPR